MNPSPRLAAACALAIAAPALAQDLYDPTVLRTLNITFHDDNWLTLLKQNYFSETLIGADLEVDGITYPDVGVRIRGNTSYTALPAGSEKFSLKVELDWVHEDQEIMSYDKLNLNNSFHDPTFCREVVYNNFVAQFIPNPRANHVVVTLNGQNWGVYANVQQPDKRMLGDFFADNDGLRIRCPNNPNGPGLTYVGANPASYNQYEIQEPGGLPNPVATLIDVCNTVTNGSLVNWQLTIDPKFAVDPSIWSVALENLLTDDDSYINKGADFMTYRDPLDGRMHLLQRDANETFTQINWAPTRNFTAANKPVLSHVLSVPELRQRYFAHYRTAAENFTWDYFGPIFEAHRQLIDAAVQADPKKLYSYTHFQNNFSVQVTLPGGGLAGGPVVGLQQFVESRSAFLASNAELQGLAPTISSVTATPASPAPDDQVWITASVAPAPDAGIQKVELWYRTSPTTTYQRTPMLDDGASNDGAAGDGAFGALLPVDAVGGQVIDYYISAASLNAFRTASFSPELAERGPASFQYALGDTGIRITEWMYSGPSGEFFEFTNTGDDPVDLTGWSYDDSNRIAGTFDLSAAGTLAPGQSVIVTESAAEAFRTAWGLPAETIIIGSLGVVTGNNLGRNDEINIYDPLAGLADRLTYGDQDFPGTIRTQNFSGQTCDAFLGANDIFGWVLSATGDEFGSFPATTGEPGTPGTDPGVLCEVPCPADLNGSGTIESTDLNTLLASFGCTGGACAGDIDGDGDADSTDLNLLLASFGTSCG